MDNNCDRLLSLVKGNQAKPNVQRISGKVISVTKDNSSALVVLTGDETTRLNFPNKSAEILSIGDSVFIEYWCGSLTSGYIATRCGFARPFGQIIITTQTEYDTLTDEEKKGRLYGIDIGGDT